MSVLDIWPAEHNENEATDQIMWYVLRCKRAGDTHEEDDRGARLGSFASEADTRGQCKSCLLLEDTWGTAG